MAATHLVKTEITQPFQDEHFLHCFMYGQFNNDYVFLRDITTGNLVIGFTDGEDALAFKLKKLDIEYLKILNPKTAAKLLKKTHHV